MKNILVSILAIICLAACNVVNTMQDSMKHCTDTSAALEKVTGVKSTVTFSSMNGALNSVNIIFESVPAGQSLDAIILDAKSAVAAEFKESPKHLVVGFAVKATLNKCLGFKILRPNSLILLAEEFHRTT